MRRIRREQGASAVEFALVLPLLLVLVLGAIDWGYYLFTAEIVGNAAREGARAGSLQAQNDAAAQTEAARSATAYLTNGGLTASNASVNVVLEAGSVAVDIRYPTPSLTGMSDIFLPANAHAVAEMRR